MKECTIAGCDRPAKARGWCKLHYYRWKRTGDPVKTLRPTLGLSASERFWTKVAPAPLAECWEWTEYVDEKGYARFWDGSRVIRAHQFSYASLIAEVPSGLELDHLCKNRRCVNPWHLDPVTHAVNMERSDNILLAKKRAVA